jgi:hypothetical protein
LKVPAIIVAACSAGLGLSACETPSYGAGGVIGAATAPRLSGLFAGVADLEALPTAAAPVERLSAAAKSDAAGPSTTPEHGTKAAALFTGRLFLSNGKVLSAPAVETPRDLIEETLPAGWRRQDDRLLHVESGLECPLNFDFSTDEKKSVLSLKDVTVYDQANRDVSCNYANGGAAAVTLYASYYPDISVEDHASAAVASMRRNFQLKGVLPVVTVEIEDKDAGTTTADLEAPIAGAFDIGEIGGAPYKTAIWIAKTQGWHVKTLATYAQADATTELVAAVIFAVNYLNIDMKSKTGPAAAGADV